MPIDDDKSLRSWGWNSAWEQAFAQACLETPRGLALVPARVVGREGPVHLLETAEGPRNGVVSGRLQYTGAEADLPLVGDWVAAQPFATDQALVHAVLTRRTTFSRAVSDGAKDPAGRQSLLAANLDVLAIVTGLDGNFNPRRAQRLDIMGFCSGSILPKIDRACMAVGLELRAPFLDRRLLDWSLSRPVRPADGPAASKPLVRSFLSRAAADGLIPPGILTRPKQGFSLRTAQDHPFTLLCPGLIGDSRLVRDGVLRRDWAAYLPADPDAREARLFMLSMLAAWYHHRAGN